jgi:uncharacterized protein YggU (UPF0235/DUF167 family)
MYIRVHVVANAKREKVEQKSDILFDISVKEPAENNLANRRVIELVAEHFRVPVSQVRILNGHHHPHKLLTVSV